MAAAAGAHSRFDGALIRTARNDVAADQAIPAVVEFYFGEDPLS